MIGNREVGCCAVPKIEVLGSEFLVSLKIQPLMAPKISAEAQPCHTMGMGRDYIIILERCDKLAVLVYLYQIP